MHFRLIYQLDFACYCGRKRSSGHFLAQQFTSALEDLKRWEEKWANSNSNNPNKFRGNINEARSRVRLIERVLKTNGTLPLTVQEQLNKDLDAKFPKARSKDVIEFEGKRYQLRFSPAVKSRSRKVKEWDRTWVLLGS